MMKIISLSALLFVLSSQLFSVTVVTGTWNRKDEKVSLFEVENGRLKEIASFTLSPKKEFSFAFQQTAPGFYVVGTSPHSPMNNYVFYLNPDEQLLDIDVDDDVSYSLPGKNTLANKEIERWHNLILPLKARAVYFMKFNSNYVDYFPLLEEKLIEIDAYTPATTDDEVFNNSFNKYRYYDLLTDVLNFINTPRSEHPKIKDFPEFLNTVSLAEITADPAILGYPYGMRLIDFVRRLSIKRLMENASKEEASQISDTYEALHRDLPQIQNLIVKGEVILETGQSIKSFEGLNQFYNEFGKYLVTESQKERMHRMLVDKANIADGQEAFDFKFKNINDKEIALSDFRGKVVYIDVWATWCGPCLKEIPYLKKIESDYTDKNIVFLGVSVDSPKDYTKWKEFLVKEGLVGVQLFAGDKAEEISKPYKITGIPRFILVGKDGKIISSDAPRPSSKEVKILFDAALKK